MFCGVNCTATKLRSIWPPSVAVDITGFKTSVVERSGLRTIASLHHGPEVLITMVASRCQGSYTFLDVGLGTCHKHKQDCLIGVANIPLQTPSPVTCLIPFGGGMRRVEAETPLRCLLSVVIETFWLIIAE